MSRVIVVRHHDVDSAGFIAAAFEARGAELSVHLFPDDGPLPALDGADHVVVLGAISSVNDPDPWIAAELAWLRAADQAGVPVLGICFGAQALCAAFGGRVEAMAGQEIGWTMAESADPGLVLKGPWLEFHGDRCLLPAEAVVLARNEVCVQAFRLGRHLGVQFHPEVDGPQLKLWLDVGRPPRGQGDGAGPRSVPGRHHPRGARRAGARRPPGRRGCAHFRAAQPLRPGLPYRAVIVACMAANGRSAPSANASPRQTTRVRPARDHLAGHREQLPGRGREQVDGVGHGQHRGVRRHDAVGGVPARAVQDRGHRAC